MFKAYPAHRGTQPLWITVFIFVSHNVSPVIYGSVQPISATFAAPARPCYNQFPRACTLYVVVKITFEHDI